MERPIDKLTSLGIMAGHWQYLPAYQSWLKVNQGMISPGCLKKGL